MLLALLLTTLAQACSCEPTTTEASLKAADIVLEAKALKIENTKHGDRITLHPSKIWKGLVVGNLKVYAGNSSCSVSVKANEEYLLFVKKYAEEKRLYIQSCSGSTALENAGELIAELKKLSKPKKKLQ